MCLAPISGEVVLGSFGVCIGYKNPVPGDVSRSLDAYSGLGKARAAKNEVASIYEFALEGDSAFCALSSAQQWASHPVTGLASDLMRVPSSVGQFDARALNAAPRSRLRVTLRVR